MSERKQGKEQERRGIYVFAEELELVLGQMMPFFDLWNPLVQIHHFAASPPRATRDGRGGGGEVAVGRCSGEQKRKVGDRPTACRGAGTASSAGIIDGARLCFVPLGRRRTKRYNTRLRAFIIYFIPPFFFKLLYTIVLNTLSITINLYGYI